MTLSHDFVRSRVRIVPENMQVKSEVRIALNILVFVMGQPFGHKHADKRIKVKRYVTHLAKIKK